MAGVPGAGGRPPKRESQRRRRNKVEPSDHATSDGVVRGPDLEGEHSPIAHRWWQALRRSGQAQFFEPSDWAQAELVVTAIDSFAAKPSAMMLQTIDKMSGSLLVTEGDRRRVRLELERQDPAAASEDDADVSWIDDARNRLRGAQ